MSRTLLRSPVGRAVRFLAGAVITVWGFDLGLPLALFVQAAGVTVSVFAIANICVADAFVQRGGARAPVNHEHRA